MTGKLEAVFKSSDLHPGIMGRNLDGINSQINNAKAAPGPRLEPEWRERVLTGISNVCYRKVTTAHWSAMTPGCQQGKCANEFMSISLAQVRAELRMETPTDKPDAQKEVCEGV